MTPARPHSSWVLKAASASSVRKPTTKRATSGASLPTGEAKPTIIGAHQFVEWRGAKALHSRGTYARVADVGHDFVLTEHEHELDVGRARGVLQQLHRRPAIVEVDGGTGHLSREPRDCASLRLERLTHQPALGQADGRRLRKQRQEHRSKHPTEAFARPGGWKHHTR